jgi:hypothetical protein
LLKYPEEPQVRLEKAYRITNFVPPEHLDSVIEAVLIQTPLAYGPYDKSVWWSAVGTEQFEPREGSNPAVGKIGKTERVPTVRVEFVIPRDADLLHRVLVALVSVHPWQEPATFIDETTITQST